MEEDEGMVHRDILVFVVGKKLFGFSARGGVASSGQGGGLGTVKI